MHSTICGWPAASLRCRFCGTKPAPVPWILCGPGFSGSPASVCEITGESFGSTAIAWKLGLARADHFDAAGDGAAGADRGDEDVDLARRCRPRFPRRWSGGGSSGLAGLLNCCGIHEFGVFCCSSSARAMAPFIPSAPGVSTSFAPSMASSVRRSSDIVSGMVRMSLYPRRRRRRRARCRYCRWSAR